LEILSNKKHILNKNEDSFKQIPGFINKKFQKKSVFKTLGRVKKSNKLFKKELEKKKKHKLKKKISKIKNLVFSNKLKKKIPKPITQ
jgi:hypothetical protein